METLRERFDVLQDKLIDIYEAGSTNLDDQIEHWNVVRQESVLMNFARRQGLNRLGMQQLPALAVSETNAKNAIMMTLYLKSLKESPYAQESWGLSDTSLELFLAAPIHTFKKQGFSVDVLFDRDEDNLYTYTAWKYIYYQDDDGEWHKVESGIDYDGIYYEAVDGHNEYYVKFEDDAPRFGKTGQWTVKYKSRTISASVTSTSRSVLSSPSSSQEFGQQSSDTVGPAPQPKRFRVSGPIEPERISTRSFSSTVSKTTEKESPKTRYRRGGRKGESATTRSTRTTSRGARRRVEHDYPTPGEVGSIHRSVERSHLTRLGQLQREAWDPPLALLRGPANTLKCFRFRCFKKHRGLFSTISTTFSWVGDGAQRLGNARILIAFESTTQRARFLEIAVLPKGTQVVFGSLDGL